MNRILFVITILISTVASAANLGNSCLIEHDKTGVPSVKSLKECQTGFPIFGSAHPQAATAFIATFCDFSKSLAFAIDSSPSEQKVLFSGSVANFSCVYSGTKTWESR